MSIPPSPPGTPPPAHAALTNKFDTFLRLKRTQHIHFNDRLASAAGMKNPALGDKLLAFIGIDTAAEISAPPETNNTNTNTDPDPATNANANANGDGNNPHYDGAAGAGLEQYATTLGPDVYPDAGRSFPAWAYRGALRKAQERGQRERERAKGEAVEFVSASSSAAAAAAAMEAGGSSSSRGGTPGVGGRGPTGTGTGTGKRKGRWDT